MPLLARMIRQRRAWVELGGDLPGDMAFPAGVISDLYDARGGASFWLVSARESEDVRRLVANLACMSNELNPQEIRFVDEQDVKALGIDIRAKKSGEIPDKGLGGNHSDLYVQTNGQAVDLAKKMLLIEPIVMTAEDVIACVAASIERGYFEISSLNRDILKALAKAGALRMNW